MGMVVRTNTMAQNAYRQLGMNNTSVGKSLEKLSSGFRINRAADDASGLAISEKMKAQIKGLEQASANSQDGISLIQTAEGATTEIHNMLNRMTELATKSANGTIQNEVDREAIQQEVDDLNAEITRIAESTNFNGINLLNGNLSSGSTAINGGRVPFKLSEAQHAGLVTKQPTAASSTITLEDATTPLTNNQTVSFDVSYQDADGKAQTISLTFTADTTNDKLVAADGTTYSMTTGGAMTAEDLAAAVTGELTKDTVASKNFTVTDNADGTMDFVAKTKGADSAKLLSVKQVCDTTTETAALSVTSGTDKSYSIATGNAASNAVTSWDGTTGASSDFVFEVGGKKFAFVQSAAAAEKLDKDVNYVVTGGAAPATAEVSNMATLIGQKTGISGISVAAGATVIDFAATTKTNGGGLKLQVGDTNEAYNHVTVSVDDLSAAGIGTAGLKVSDQDAAGDAIDVIKKAINQVSTNRANLGSLQNRLEYTINNLDTTAENMTAANSRIRDTDMAKEMMNYTKMNILTQSAQAMLAQANQAPQAILQLLQ